jgi:hypothetical protein
MKHREGDLTVSVSVRKITGKPTYAVRMGGVKVGVIRRDEFYGWDWVDHEWSLDDATLNDLVDVIHRLMGTDDEQRKASGLE